MADPIPIDGSLASMRDRDQPIRALPVPRTSFVGRVREIGAVSALVRRDGVRLVTLTGPGGIGKTRLALRVAGGADHGIADVRFVPLSSIVDPDLVGPAVARALDVRTPSVQPIPDQIRTVVGGRRLLLLLDNVEQVLESSALLAGILDACPGLTILATSRQPLRIAGEHEYAVPPLPLRRENESLAHVSRLTSHVSEAVALFEQRARAVRPDFSVTPENADTISAICARLDGVPLAIELAAVLVKAFSPGALLARVDGNLGLLTGGPRDAPPRLRTLRDAIGWSHDLLDPDEQALFRRLAVFAGGFRLSAAAWVTGDGPASSASADGHDPRLLDLVVSLVDKSLLHPREHDGPEARFGMLTTVRAFALERLTASGEEVDIRNGHADWCVRMAERRWTAGCGTAEHPGWLAEIEPDLDNMRTALAWLERSGDGARMQRLAVAIDRLWKAHGSRTEAVDWLERALACGAATDQDIRRKVVAALGSHLERRGLYEPARILHEEELRSAEEQGSPLDIAYAQGNLGVVALNDGRYRDAVAMLEGALAAYLRLGNDGAAHWTRYCLGIAAYGQDDLARATTLVETALAGFRAYGENEGVVVALDVLGALRAAQGATAAAACCLNEALPLWRRQGNSEGMAEWLGVVAALAVTSGQTMAAARLYGAAEAAIEVAGVPQVVPPPGQYRRSVERLRSALGSAAVDAAWAAGRALPLARAVDEALDVLETSVAAPSTERVSVSGVGLTPREWEVARLVAQGRSNREIASTLSISVPTVKRHLTNVLGKLDLPSRSALNTFVHAQGLT